MSAGPVPATLLDQALPAPGDLGPGRAVDLAGRALGGVVVACNDQFFADASHLLLPHPATHDPRAFDARGKVYDGWETRRRRTPGSDWVVVRLASAGTVERIDVDTAFFRGNYPPECSLDGVWLPGFPGPTDVAGLPEAAWTPLVPRSSLTGDAVTSFDVARGSRERRVSHVRLRIHPDGGVARLRVVGRPVPDPALLSGTVDLLAAELGGAVVAASDEFYASAGHLLLPGRAAVMSQGWENARRRDGGHDWVLLALAAPGVPRRAEVDTACFVGNAPGRVRLLGLDARIAGAQWGELLDLAPQPDTRHVVPLVAEGGPAALGAVTHVLLQVHPDGGMSRLRLWGELDAAATRAAADRWAVTAP